MLNFRQCFRIIFFLFLFLITGCTGKRANPLAAPSGALSSSMQNAAEDPLIELSQPLCSNWWTLFNDDQLTHFIYLTFARNPTIQEAYANIFLAQANADRVRATLFPNLYWGADVSRSKLSQTGLAFPNGPTPSASATGPSGLIPLPPGSGVPFQGGKNGIPVYFTQYETELNLTYEFDFWGKNRNTLRAALGEVYANMADQIFVQLELGIEVAQTYYKLQVDYQRRQIAQRLVQSQVDYQRYIEERVKNHLDYVPTLSNANINLAASKQSLLAIEANIIVNENRLKTYLAGDFEEAIAACPIDEQRLPKVPLPGDLPVHLIAYRPDITAKLWTIESAGKRIDVAKAGFYPDFSLTALFGFQTIRLHELFNWPSTYFNINPAVTLPIFDAGRLKANLRASEINYDIAIYEYNQLILEAVREILDGIALLRNAEQQLQVYRDKVEQQERLLATTRLRVENNIDSGLNMLISEQNLMIAQDQQLIAYGNTLQAVLSLIKALGGGYQTCYIDG